MGDLTLPATGSWAIYSAQRKVPGLPGGHNYLVLADSSGTIVAEMHGTYTQTFAINGADPGNYLRVTNWNPNEYEQEQAITDHAQVFSGTENDMKTLFQAGYDAVKAELDEKHMLYNAVTFIPFDHAVNSNSVWYTALKVMGVADPSEYNGPLLTPGDDIDLREEETNNEWFGTGQDPWSANPNYTINPSLMYGSPGISGLNPDDGFQVVDNEGDGLLANTTYTYDTNAALTQVKYTFSNDNSYAFGAKNHSDLNFDSEEDILTVNLTTASGVVLGLLVIDVTNSTGSLTLANREEIIYTLDSIPNQASIIEASGSPLQMIVGYLGDLGHSTTLAALKEDNLDDLYEEGTPYTPTGTVHALSYSEANYVIETSAAAAIVVGEDLVTIQTGVDEFNNPIYGQVAPTNILQASGDISQHEITDVDILQLSGNAALTEEQFELFASIEANGLSLSAATGGTFDASSITISDLHHLVATDWSGTTLIGNNENEQILQASLFGDDTLQAGDGDDTMLVAGKGVNTLIGGTGGTTFVASSHSGFWTASSLNSGDPINGLAPGSVVEGHGTGNVLYATGDITQSTISGIQTLNASGSLAGLTLTADQFNSFDTIEGGSVLYAATGGTYDWSEQENGGFSEAYALSSEGTTLIGNALGVIQWLHASASGNDTLIAPVGNFRGLDAGNSTGDMTLTVGDGDNNAAYAGYGVTTVTLGTGDGNGVYAEHGLAAGSSIASENTTTSRLVANGDISGATITGIYRLDSFSSGTGVTLNATQLAGFGGIVDNITSGPFMLTAASAGNYSLVGKTIPVGHVGLNGSSGNDTLTGSSGENIINGNGGADTIRGMAGADTINGGDGDDIIQIFSGEVPSGESIDGGNGTDRLTVGNNSMNPSAMTVANMEELYLNSGVTAVTLSASQLADFETITQATSAGFTITAAAAGTYSLSGKTLTGAATLSGSSGADTLTGSANADTLNGNNGDDIIEGGSGNDTLNGGANTDTLTHANASSAVTVDLSNASAQNTGGAGTDTISNFENLTGSVYNDNLTGTSSANILQGGDGNDTISGAAGADTIDGGVGTNSLTGGTGNDTYMLERTYGASDIFENDSTGGNTDVLQLGDDIAPDQVWFTQSGNDLVVQVIGTGAQMTIQDWYSGSDYHVEQIVTDDEDVLDHSDVQNLVSAMSGLSVPETTTLSGEYHTALDSVIAANWA